VHLAGEADGGNRFGGDAALGEDRANRKLAGAPPVVRILLRPGGLRRGERGVVGGPRREQPAILVENQRARPAGANVDAQYWNSALVVS
jgi:hypothetical protein